MGHNCVQLSQDGSGEHIFQSFYVIWIILLNLALDLPICRF